MYNWVISIDILIHFYTKLEMFGHNLPLTKTALLTKKKEERNEKGPAAVTGLTTRWCNLIKQCETNKAVWCFKFRSRSTPT